jgi:signal transduction histidine kinase
VQLAREASVSVPVQHHEIVFDADDTVVGSFDRIRLRQLLDNLLENAVKYSPEGGRIMVKVWQEDHAARLSVADQGIGIPASDLPHIFERFYRAKNVDDQQFAGMGLGLFICCAIVEQHGGRIWAQSSKAMGTTFHVLLPLDAPEQIGRSAAAFNSPPPKTP